MTTSATLQAQAPQRRDARLRVPPSFGALANVYRRSLLDRFLWPSLAVAAPVVLLAWAIIAPTLVTLDPSITNKLYLTVAIAFGFSLMFLVPWWRRRDLQVSVHQGGIAVRKGGTLWLCPAEQIAEIWRCTNAQPKKGKPQRGMTIVRVDGESISIGTELSGWLSLRNQLEDATFARHREASLALLGAGLSISFGNYRVNLQGIRFSMPHVPEQDAGLCNHALAWTEIDECRLEKQWLRLKKPGTDWYLATTGAANFHVMTAVIHELWSRSRRTSYIPGRS